MAFTFSGESGTNTATIPSHSAGDLIVAFAYRDGNVGAPTIPSGQNWTTVFNTNGANFNSHSIAIKTATSSSESTGSFVGATSLIVIVVKSSSGTIGYKNGEIGTGSSTTLSFTGFTLDNPTDSSIILAFAAHRSVNTTTDQAPTGFTNITSVLDSADGAAAHYSTDVVSSFSTLTQSVGGTSSGWRTHTLEVWEVIEAQDLIPTRYDNVNGFYTHTVSVGAVSLNASRYENSNGFYAATVTQSVVSQDLTASRFNNSNTFYSHAVAVGNVSLTASLFGNTNTFYQPTVNRGAVYLSASLYSNTNTFYAPSISASAGSQSLTSARFDNANTFFVASVGIGSVGLTTDLFTNTSLLYDPVITVGALDLTLEIFVNTNDFYTHEILLLDLSQTLEASFYQNVNTFYINKVSNYLIGSKLRTLIIEHENRGVNALDESREISIDSDYRRLNVTYENRSLTVEKQVRTVVIK